MYPNVLFFGVLDLHSATLMGGLDPFQFGDKISVLAESLLAISSVKLCLGGNEQWRPNCVLWYQWPRK